MLSKMLPWDYVSKFKTGFNLTTKGIISLVVEDPFIDRLIKDRLPKKELNIRVFVGSEITNNFLEENFYNYSLFSETSDLMIINSELIPIDVLSKLLLELEEYSDSFIFLIFQKTNKGINELFKKTKLNVIEIETPKFWEGPKLLSFLCRELKLNLTSEVNNFILENVEHNSESFFHALQLINLNFENNKIDLNLLKELITRERFDFFSQLDLYHSNNSNFFKSIMPKELDFEWLMILSISMQSHLVKILNPEEIRKKDKPTKYDLNILKWSEQMTREEIKNELVYFSELEIMAKMKDTFIKEKLRMRSIK
jgi:hypothetical protein